MNIGLISVFSFGFVLISRFTAVCQKTAGDEANIVIGVLSTSPNDTVEEVQAGNVTIRLRWYPVNVTDIRSLMWTVHHLDDHDQVDMLVLLDWPQFLLDHRRSLLRTVNKPLLYWTANTSLKVTLSYDNMYHMGSEQFCQDNSVEPIHFRSRYCPNDYWDDDSDALYVDRTLFPGASVLTKLVVHLGWKKVYILYETVTEHEATHLLKELSNNTILYALYNIDHVIDGHVMLRNIYRSALQRGENIYFIVICRQKGASTLLAQARDFDAAIENKNRTVLSRISHWLVGLYGRVNRTCLQQHAGSLDHVLVINIPEVNEKLERENATEYFLRRITHFRSTNSTHGPSGSNEGLRLQLSEYIQKVNLHHVLSGVCTGSRIETLGWNTPLRELRTVGIVKLDGHVVIKHDLFPNVAFGYNRRQFLISVIEYPPYVTKVTENGTTRYSGFCITILKELAASLNFTYRLTESSDGNYGMVVNHTTMEFNGLIGQLQRREVDMVVGDIAIQKDREQVMDFTFPFYYGYTTVILKKPDPNKDKWRKLLEPFKLEVIAVIGLALLVSSLVLNRLEVFNPFYNTGPVRPPGAARYNRHGGTRFKNYSGTLLWLFGTLCNEGNLHLPASTTGRTFVSFWWLFCLVIIATYSGNLIAILAVTKNELPFNSLEEMAPKEGIYKWGLIGGTFWEQIFLTSEKSEFKAVGGALARFNRTDPTVLSKSQAFHLARVETDDNYAFIGDDAAVDVATSNNCDLIKIKERFLSMSNAFGFPDKSPHTKIFNEKMMAMHETGLLSIWKKQLWPDSSRCKPQASKIEQRPVQLLDVQSAFYIIAIGLFVSAVVLGIERAIAKKPCQRKCPTPKSTDEPTE